jgi:hypothetical protein
MFGKGHKRYIKYICMQYNIVVLTLEFAELVIHRKLEGLGGGGG